VKLDQQTETIVGVMPRSFSAPGGVDLWHAAQVTPNDWAMIGATTGGQAMYLGGCGWA